MYVYISSEIKLYYYYYYYKPDFICGAESWLNSSIKNGEIFPTSFNVFRKDRETIGGGVFRMKT